MFFIILGEASTFVLLAGEAKRGGKVRLEYLSNVYKILGKSPCE